MHGWQSLTDDYMPIGMSVTSTGVCCVFLTVTVSTPLSKRAVMPLMSALSGNCRQQHMKVSTGSKQKSTNVNDRA